MAVKMEILGEFKRILNFTCNTEPQFVPSILNLIRSLPSETKLLLFVCTGSECTDTKNKKENALHLHFPNAATLLTEI